MRILFIRHAKALLKEEWNQDDLFRPLSEEGEKKAKSFFQKLPKIYDKLDIIVSSKATRAIQTAKILKTFYPEAKYLESSKINPGAAPLAYKELIEKLRGYEEIAFVGHEPDISLIVSELIGCTKLQIEVKKSGVIELRGDDTFELFAMLYPKILRRL